MFASYFIYNYAFLVANLGLLTLMLIGGRTNDKINTVMLLSSVSSLVLSVLTHIDVQLSVGTVYNPVRFICSVYAYILRPSIIHVYIEGFCRDRRMLWFTRACLTVNFLVYMASFFTDAVVYIDSQNAFHSPYHLNYTAYFVSAIMLICLVFVSLKHFKSGDKLEAVWIGFIAAANIGGALLDTYDLSNEYLLVTTIGISNCLYFIYAYARIQRLDVTTGLPNRSSFFIDAGKRRGKMTAVISVDMNELKWINDTEGHNAGDEALRGVSMCLKDCLPQDCGVYRIGGDEFYEILRGLDEAAVIEQTVNTRAALEKAGYSCAIGYAMIKGGNFNAACREADDAMYADKQRMKQETAEGKTEIHFREERLRYFRDN